MPRDEKPCQKFNLVVYYDKNKRLKTPIFHENVYIFNDENYIYAYDVERFETEHEDPVVEMMCRVISTVFKYCGIWISGMEHSRVSGETYLYQSWLVTTLTREELEKEHWYGY